MVMKVASQASALPPGQASKAPRRAHAPTSAEVRYQPDGDGAVTLWQLPAGPRATTATTADAAVFAQASAGGQPVVSVPVHWHFWSEHPSIPVDFRASGLLSALRFMARIRNLDGPDDLAGNVPLAASQANQPYIQFALLAALAPLVLLAAKNALRHARHCYDVAYPATVAAMLLQQLTIIESLRLPGVGPDGRAVPGLTEAALAQLVCLHRRGVQLYLRRCEERRRGLRHLLAFNLRRRRHGFRGNGELSRLFDVELQRVVEDGIAASRSPAGEHLCYEVAKGRRAEDQRQAAKNERGPSLVTGIALSSMFKGMTTSIAAASAKAVHNRAAAAGNVALAASSETAAHAAEIATGAIMGVAQLLQGLASLANLAAHRHEYERLQDDLSDVHALAEGLPPEALRLFEQDIATRLRASVHSQVLDGTLTGGQALMLLSTIIHFPFPGAFVIALAGPGALATVVSAVLAAGNEESNDAYQGASTPDAVKARQVPQDIGMRVRAEGHAAVVEATAAAYLQEQHGAEQTALWALMVDMLAGEDVLAPWPTRTPAERREALAASILRPRKKGDRAHLLAVGVEGLQRLLAARYPVAYFDRPLLEIHHALAAELAAHPAAAAIEALEEFRQEVLHATVNALGKRPDARTSPLFRNPDGSLRSRIHADPAWHDFVRHDPAAHALERLAHNRILASMLGPGGLFGRAAQQTVLIDLARGEALFGQLARAHGQGLGDGGIDPADALAGGATASGNEGVSGAF